MSASNRNKPCCCGSGYKTKKCCDSAEAVRAAQEKAMQEYRERRIRELELRKQEEDDSCGLMLSSIAAGEPMRQKYYREPERRRYPCSVGTFGVIAVLMAASLGGRVR